MLSNKWNFYNGNKEKITSLKDVLLNVEDLAEHAKEIAKLHSTVKGKKTYKLLRRLDKNFKDIVAVYLALNKKSYLKKDLTPASEWLLDNFYKIEEQVKVIRETLVQDKYLQGNILESGLLKGYPRAYVIALELVSHTDGRIDEGIIKHFITAYQSKRVLSIAEIWAIALMLQLALIENIRILCNKILVSEVQWVEAEKALEKGEDILLASIQQNIEGPEGIRASYIQHILRRLKREGQDSVEIINYIEKRISDFNVTISQLIEDEHNSQASRKVSMGNSITSLNTISSIDWNQLFEKLSVVDEILRKDPAKLYELMDFDSRNHYRRQVEEIAKAYNLSELKVAKTAIELAQNNISKEKENHVGYYLVDKGRIELLGALGINKIMDTFPRYPLWKYTIPIGLITLAIIFLTFWYNFIQGENNLWIQLITMIIVLIPASEIAVVLTNWFYMNSIPPTFIPRLELKEGIPLEATTMVVVPTLIPNGRRLKELIEMLEVYYLANKEENIYFAIAGDFKDSEKEIEETDKDIIDIANNEIKRLNEKYSKEKNIFYYFHRKRQFSKNMQKWMGWERKRGALVELNQLLLGNNKTSYTTIVGSIEKLPRIKYVITLDADTNLPLDTAKKLIGIISHPINKPVFDEEKGIVKEGYGLIQPKISNNIESVNSSPFTKIFAGEGGIDAYLTVYSDVYQDLFGEGIFTGKGIYDLEIFDAILREAIPDDSVLSHDLLEGGYVRGGLATDIELIDGFPAKYTSYIKRLHRWVRGDWQLIRWLPSRIKRRNGEMIKNPLSKLTKWKIIDNLRRSFLPVALMILIVAGAFILPGSFLVWFSLGALTVFIPFITGVMSYLIKGVKGANGKHNSGNLTAFKNALFNRILAFILLPYEAYMLGDAITRTLYRIYISKKRLLEWVTMTDVEINSKGDISSFLHQMRAAIYIPVILIALTLMFVPHNLAYILPLALLWLLSPFIAYYVSKPITYQKEALSPQEERVLRRLARKTWSYFEDFANEGNNFLPPDNYQVNPGNGVAYRTSPTNIGFHIMSVLAARDFGYITTTKMVEECKKTIKTIEKMEKWNGHLYNWYDTRSLKVLRPKYVSTVDSGNFITYLITFNAGLEDYYKKPFIDKALLEGGIDTLGLSEAEGVEEIKIDDSCNLVKFQSILETLSKLPLKEGKWKNKAKEQLDSLKHELKNFYPSIDYVNIIEFQIKSEKVQKLLDLDVSLLDMVDIYDIILNEISSFIIIDEKHEIQVNALKEEMIILKERIHSLIEEMKALQKDVQVIIDECKFIHLYDEKRNLFSIGYNEEDERLTNSYYDLLASEVRTTSYLSIARKEIPKKHWFKMGRRLTMVNGSLGLVSWTGTMFEYFMPYIIMKKYCNTLWDETYQAVIKAQKKFASKRNVPWGVSESGYYAFDMQLNYQYQAFGVPIMGLKRGLVDYTVISPYSTLLVLPIRPKDAIENINRLVKEGYEGEYGFYEAIDYSPILLKEKGKQVIESFMAHHQGMILTSLVNYFKGMIMQKRFHSTPIVKAAEILLQEKKPVRGIITNEFVNSEPIKEYACPFDRVTRVYGKPLDYPPKCHLLSNGKYSIMLTNKGTGYSKAGDVQVTRWREDAIEDKLGSFIFLRNVTTDETWSATYEPIYDKPQKYKVIFSQDKAEFICKHKSIDTNTEIVVSHDERVEIRRVKLTNHSQTPVIIELTSYQEVVLNNAAADLAHPAFSNLFVTTEAMEKYDALLASRRTRDHHDKERWIFHTATIDGETIGGLQYETNRGSFIGRGRSISNPAALTQPLTNSVGIAIDPVLSIRKTVKVEGGKWVEVAFITGIGDSKEEVIKLLRSYKDYSSISRSFQLALTRSEVEANFLNLKAGEIATYQDMISQLIFLSPLKRKYNSLMSSNNKGQSGLWPYGISGDLPILLLTIGKATEMDLVQEALKSHEYLRTKGLIFDLVILNEDESSYFQSLQRSLTDLVMASHGRHLMDQQGGIFIRNTSMMPKEDICLFYAAARIVLKGDKGSISRQLKLQEVDDNEIPPEIEFSEKYIPYDSKDEGLQLDFFNGYGGFSKDGREYVIRLKENMNTPAPWINVIANEKFGFLASESSCGATWSKNSRENKLTPWSNDPVSDPPSEVTYIRDNGNGAYWTITPLPIRGKESYTIHHGGGYTTYKHNSHGINQTLTMFVHKEEAIKFNLIALENKSNKPRSLSIVYFLRPVLGISPELTQQFIKSWNLQNQGIAVMNPYNTDFGHLTAYASSTEDISSYTCDRGEFIGIDGGLSHPKALKRRGLSNREGTGYDPCIALEINIQLKANEVKEVAFYMGQEEGEEICRQVIAKYKNVNKIKAELEIVKDFWISELGRIKVNTPDLSMNLMLNQWLLYQTIACRLWGRTAFYQSGGAYGYRDQLQDVMSLIHIMPQVTKKQILLHSQHQFLEGDVQHWWHPGAGEKGIRTRFSDDLLWLPYVTAEYIYKTGDYEVLKEETHYLEEAPLQEGEDERYGIPKKSSLKGSIYEHCIKAIDRGLNFGANKIPLMGSGDWNDGMNTVGNKGKGESVWLGWFLYSILKKFAPIAEKMKDYERGKKYLEMADNIAKAIEENAWDGEWYIRAFYDDGSPLGSSKNTECIIDSLAQSWCIISDGGNEKRRKEAMGAVDKYLVKQEEGMILLFTPPFDKSHQNPGYIKGYVPGVRENGGQYSHAASWVIMAYAEMGMGEKAWQLYNMINPINHTRTPLECSTYKVEPYVMAADVYAVAPHTGRGGWTWYTGVAGWMYRIGIENILGLKIEGNRLTIKPCIPKDWNGYTIEYKYMDTPYSITVNNNNGGTTKVNQLILDGTPVNEKEIQLENDGKQHKLEVIMGE